MNTWRDSWILKELKNWCGLVQESVMSTKGHYITQKFYTGKERKE